ncbi:MAG: phosphate acetyltransferase [Clostridiales bacterium]
MAKNLFLASTSANTGKGVVALGLMNALKCLVPRVGYMKPIGQKYKRGENNDKESIMIKKIFDLSDDLDNINPVSISELDDYFSNDDKESFFQKIQKSYKTIAKNKDIVIIDGTDYKGMMSSFEFDINANLANNLNASVIVVEDGYGKDNNKIICDIITSLDSFEEHSCDVLGVIINKVDPDQVDALKNLIKKKVSKNKIEFFGAIPYSNILSKPRLSDIAKVLEADVVFGEDNLDNIAVNNQIGSMKIENILKYLKDGSLYITGGDRDDVLLGLSASYISLSFPNISGIILTGGFLPQKVFLNLIKSLPGLSIPILSVKTNTIETANKINAMEVHIPSYDSEKINLAKSIIQEHIDISKIQSKLMIKKKEKRTPEIFKYEILEMARSKKMKIVLPEGDEERTLKAADVVIRKNIADIILLGDEDKIARKINNLNLSLDGKVEIINPVTSEKFMDYTNTYLEIRKNKNYTKDIAMDRMHDTVYFGTMMVYKGDAHGLVSGAVHTTQHTIRPSFEIIKTKKGISIASSIFFMCLKDSILVYGDCAVNPEPSANELATIAISSADTARSFGIEPIVAMLSYSTGKSGKGPEVEHVRKATEIVRELRPDISVEGPIQYDAAVDQSVAKVKLPDSKVAGNATVLIFPDLNTGNNTYKAVQRSSRAIAIGPVLQGLNKPVNDLSRGCLIDDIVYTIAITAIQAQNS